MNTAKVVLSSIAEQYPPALRDIARRNILRQTFHIETVVRLAPNGSIADIGGGINPFSAGCAASGMHSILIDDFRDPANETHGDQALDLHRSLGVTVYNRDVIADGIGLAPESVDIITSFDSMEHWHNSPKRLFAEVMTALKPGGWFFLGVPNCVNLRKRITVPMGKGKWSAMADWYDRPTFRGHVREPDVGDLLYIAQDMQLTDVSILGKNWLAYYSGYAWARRCVPFIDAVLQRRPSLCSDLYVLGRKQL